VTAYVEKVEKEENDGEEGKDEGYNESDDDYQCRFSLSLGCVTCPSAKPGNAN